MLVPHQPFQIYHSAFVYPNLNVSLTSILNNTRRNGTICISRSNTLPLELRQQPLISLIESPRATESIHLACSAEIRLAGRVSRGIRGGESLAINGSLNGCLDVLEDVSFCEDIAAVTDFEGVTAVIMEVVVYLFY